ncbi:MAG TPA: ATP-binding protein [Gaiellaceae bacterium]|nr:ATP-binding protein [Gaiellaceae bacterium]
MHDVRGLTARLLTVADAKPGRFLLGITGPPGAGKSTLANALAASVLNQRGRKAALVASQRRKLARRACSPLTR